MCNLDNAAIGLNALREAAKKEMTDILAVSSEENSAIFSLVQPYSIYSFWLPV